MAFEQIPDQPIQMGGVDAPAPQAAPEGQSAAPEQLYDVKIGGVVQKVTLKDALSGYMKGADYTRKTQELSAQQRDWTTREQQYMATLQAANSLLSDRQRLSQYLASLGGPEAQQPQLQPDEVLTVAQAQKLIEQQTAQQQSAFGKSLQDLQVRIETQRATDQYAAVIDGKLAELSQKYPLLPQIAGMENTLREAVRAQQPQSIEDAMRMMDETAAYYAQSVEKLVRQQSVGRQVPAGSPLNNGIVPQGGTSLQAVGPQTPKFRSVTDPGLRQLVIDDLLRAARPAGG